MREQGFQLDFAPSPSRRHIGEHPLQVPYARREVLHLAQPFVHLLQPFTHQAEGFAQPSFQSRLQLFIHRLPHLLQFFGIVGLDGL